MTPDATAIMAAVSSIRGRNFIYANSASNKRDYDMSFGRLSMALTGHSFLTDIGRRTYNDSEQAFGYTGAQADP